MRYLYILFLSITCLSVSAQKASKIMTDEVFKAMGTTVQADIDKEMNSARDQFNKVLLKDTADAMANLGLAIVYSHDTYSGHDYFKGWYYFQKAEHNMASFSDDDKLVLNDLFFRQDKKRRGRPIKQNMEWERTQIEEKLIKFVREENKLEYALKFLSEFPNSRYVNNVTHIRNYIEFRTAENTNTEEAFNNFLKKYPDAAQFSLASELRDKLAFEKAKASNTVTALKFFITNYPNAPQIEEAKKILSILAFTDAAKTRKIDAIDNFMAQYPNSPKMPEAKILKRQLVFEWAKSVNTLEAYNQFVMLYPEGEQYVDIFNLKAKAMGQNLLMQFPFDNYLFITGFDNNMLDDFGGSVAVTPQNQVLLVVNSKKDESEMIDNWLLMLDENGKMLWNKFLGNTFDDKANKVLVQPNGDIVVAGETNFITDSIRGKSWLYKLKPDGKNVYNRTLDGTEIVTMASYQNGENIVGGYTIVNDTTSIPVLLKVNNNGRKLWSRSFSMAKFIHQLITNADQTAYIAAGGWVAAIDKMGYIIWDKIMEQGQNITSVNVDINGNPVFAGTFNNKGYVFSADNKGKQLWENSFDIADTENVYVKELAGSDTQIIAWCQVGSTIQSVAFSNKGEFLKTNVYDLPGGISINGITKLGSNQLIISATHHSQTNDIVLFKIGF